MGSAVAFGSGVPVQMALSSPVPLLGARFLLSALSLSFLFCSLADTIFNKGQTYYVSLVDWTILPFNLMIKESTFWWLERRLSGWEEHVLLSRRTRVQFPAMAGSSRARNSSFRAIWCFRPPWASSPTCVHIHMIKMKSFWKSHSFESPDGSFCEHQYLSCLHSLFTLWPSH